MADPMNSEEPMDCELQDPVPSGTPCAPQQPNYGGVPNELSLQAAPQASSQPLPQGHHSSPVQQITAAEYREQSVSYTQQALRELKASPEYKKHTQKCQSCGSSWYEGHWVEGCDECGGCGMTQPCPLCSGRCGETWTRSVDMSHRTHEAHWDGECGLSHDQQAVLMVRKFLQTQDDLADALQDLNTSTS